MTAAPFRVAFVCVQNAGRSQMATAFAEQERRQRGMEHAVEVVTGGTRPAERVHEDVVDAMNEVGIDLTVRTPRTITHEELERTDVVVTMGCAAADVCPAGWSGDARDWALADPDGKPLEAVRAIRDEVERRVGDLFDELEREVPPRV